MKGVFISESLFQRCLVNQKLAGVEFSQATSFSSSARAAWSIPVVRASNERY
jgi:hypothetical protein